MLRRIRAEKTTAAVPRAFDLFHRREKLFYVPGDLVSQPRTGFEQAEDHTGQPQIAVQTPNHDFDRLQQLAQTVEGQEMRLQRQENLLNGDQGELSVSRPRDGGQSMIR